MLYFGITYHHQTKNTYKVDGVKWYRILITTDHKRILRRKGKALIIHMQSSHYPFLPFLFLIFYCIPDIVKHTRTYFYELDFKLFDVTSLNKVLYCVVL